MKNEYSFYEVRNTDGDWIDGPFDKLEQAQKCADDSAHDSECEDTFRVFKVTYDTVYISEEPSDG